MCRWLLLSLDRHQGDELVMTQALIASMLGVRREGALLLCDERAGHDVVRCDQHRDPHRARWRRLCRQRPQVVHHRRRASSGEAYGAQAHARHTLLLVPMNTPGLTLVRNVPVMQQQAIDGHCELLFQNVRVPVANRLGDEGAGFALAQARLGPGRVHHCMRSIGQCELAIELMSARALERRAFGRALGDFANVQDWIAHSRVEIDQARLLVLHAAWRIDTQGAAAARIDVAAIKLVAAQLQTRVLDRAMQVFGAMGLTPDTPLAQLWSWGRAMRFLGGPDEVHLRTIARAELARQGRCRVDQPVPAALDAAALGRLGYLSGEASENGRLERSAAQTAKYKCPWLHRTTV